MRKPIVLLLSATILLLVIASCGNGVSESDAGYARLDSLIDRAGDFEQEKLLKIAELRRKEEKAVIPSDAYMLSSLIFDEYSVFNSDSATKYVDRMIDLSLKSGNREWEIRSKIGKASLLAATGLLKESEEIMRSIDYATLPTDLLIEYYGQMIYLFSHYGNYAGGDSNEYYVRERAYKDSIMEIITPAHPDYLWYKSWDIIGAEKDDDTLIPALEKRVDASRLNTRRDAKEAYILAQLWKRAGDMKKYSDYMIQSAIADVKIANADVASLEELARLLYARGDIDRAYRYVNYCLNKAIVYPNRVRAISITRLLDEVNNVYQQRSRAEQMRSHVALTVVCILAAVLISAIVIIIVQNRRLRRQGRRLDKANKDLSANISGLSEAQSQLHEANSRLTELNADLQRKNEELYESNYVKEEYIGYVFTICSNYIRKLEDFRSSIYVKAITGKYKDILAETESTDMMRDELRDFYRSFDSIFLHIYPDFVADFNSLLQEDKRITPKDGELLNTELRIYALVRLGITDSIKIAEFLHCSPQTVYNNRFKVRNKALVPKKNFAEAVRGLGKFADRPS